MISIVLTIAAVALIGWTLHARLLGRSLRQAWTDLDEAALTVARIAAERARAELRSARSALRSIKRRTAIRRVARYCRQLRDDLDVADVVDAELTGALREQAEHYDAAIGALTRRVPRETSASIAAWQNETFGPATTSVARVTRTWNAMYEAFDSVRFRCDLSVPRPNLSRAIRAAEELAELIQLLVIDDNAAKAPEEVADIDIVLRGIDAAHKVERAEMVDRKMAKNRARRWNVTGDGHGQHIEESCSARTAFADGELDAERAAAFRAHLDGCSSCRAQLVDDVQLAARLSALEAKETT